MNLSNNTIISNQLIGNNAATAAVVNSNSNSSTTSINNSSTMSHIVTANGDGSGNGNGNGNGVSSKKRPRLSDYQNRKTRRRIWQEDEVHKLIYVWRMRFEDLRQSKKNRHIYEEISEELNRMGLDTIREEVHIKIQNLSQLYRNEKRRFLATGEASSWLYYHEVDELLGANQDNSMDATNDESEVVSIGDTGSDPDTDDNNQSPIGHEYKNGFDMKLQNITCDLVNAFSSPSTSLASSIKATIAKPQIIASNSALRLMPIELKEPPPLIPKTLTMDEVQVEILNEIRRGNALNEREYAESRALHLEMKSLEEQRFKMTQMFIERSLTLQKQMLDCLRAKGSKSLTNGSESGGDSPYKYIPRGQSSRPQFVLSKKKK